MSELSHRITNVLLRVVVDPGHGGHFSEYRIDEDEDVYQVTMRISRPFTGTGRSASPPPLPPSRTPRPLPASGENHLKPSHITETLARDARQVEEFLRKLSTEFNVYQMAELKSPYPFLHPTFYSFSFRDSAGKNHSFEYHIECSNHLDEKYKRLIQEFDNFFESGRVFDKFLKSQR